MTEETTKPRQNKWLYLIGAVLLGLLGFFGGPMVIDMATETKEAQELICTDVEEGSAVDQANTVVCE